MTDTTISTTISTTLTKPVEKAVAEIQGSWCLLFANIPALTDRHIAFLILAYGETAVRRAIVKTVRKYDELGTMTEEHLKKYLRAVLRNSNK